MPVEKEHQCVGHMQCSMDHRDNTCFVEQFQLQGFVSQRLRPLDANMFSPEGHTHTQKRQEVTETASCSERQFRRKASWCKKRKPLHNLYNPYNPPYNPPTTRCEYCTTRTTRQYLKLVKLRLFNCAGLYGLYNNQIGLEAGCRAGCTGCTSLQGFTFIAP